MPEHHKNFLKEKLKKRLPEEERYKQKEEERKTKKAGRRMDQIEKIEVWARNL